MAMYGKLDGSCDLETYSRIDEALNDNAIANRYEIITIRKDHSNRLCHVRTRAGDTTLLFEKTKGFWKYEIHGSLASDAFTRDKINDIVEKSLVKL